MNGQFTVGEPWIANKYFKVLNFTHNQEDDLKDFNMEQLDLIDIYRTFHPKTINFTFFWSAHRTFSRTDHILGHKSSLGKFKKIEIIPALFSDHSAVRLDLNYRKKKLLKIQTYGG